MKEYLQWTTLQPGDPDTLKHLITKPKLSSQYQTTIRTLILTPTSKLTAARVSELRDILPDIGLEVEEEFTHRWLVDKWASTSRQTKKLYSPEFECNGAKWRILLFPTGNQQSDTLSVFLDSVDAPMMPKDGAWHICVQFSLAIVNYKNEAVYRSSTAQHRFNPYEADWGFNHLVKLNQLVVPLDGTNHSLVEDDQALFIVHMRVMKDVTGYLWHNYINYDSKVATGFVGFKNQGATCYMNSLLQSLYFIPYFRKATYTIPTDNDSPTKSIPLALQRVFYQLEHSNTPAATIELTKSFGWDAADSFMQHDIQEFNRVLQDNLEAKMLGTKGEGAIRKLFVGEYKSYIKCMDVEYESSRIEDFYDVQLNVKGCQGVADSFKDYISVETLEGENKYQAEGFGLQNAKKGVVFTSLPPVLFLQLKRFEYDVEKDSMIKINDRYEYPAELNLDAFLESQPATPQNYWLYGVLVHSGDITGGHYCAFLRPAKNDKWFKFDDDRVTPCLHREVFEDNFGGESLAALKQAAQLQLQQPQVTIPKPTKRFTNAYMLIYIRDGDSNTIFAPLGDEDVQDHLRVRFEAERLEQERIKKEREEAHLYVNTKVLLEDHVLKHRGFDLCNFENKAYPITPVLTMRFKKDETFAGFKEAVIKEIGGGVTVDRLSVWTLVGRQNKTVRPDTLLNSSDDNTTLEQIRQKLSNLCPDLRLFVEIGDAGGITMPGSPKPEKSLSIFLKYYDPTTSIVRYAGKVHIPNKSSKITEILPILWERAGLPSKTPLLLFEEVKPDMIDELKIKQSFAHAELGDGDIICYQRDMTAFEYVSQIEDKSIATIQQYFDTMHNRNVVVFKPRPSDRPTKFVQELELMLHKKMPYDDVLSKVGEKLSADPLKIQLFTTAGLMNKLAVKKGEKTNLNDILNTGFYNQLMATNVLYYEVLDIEVSELEKNRYVRISFVDHSMHEWGPIELLVSKGAHTSELVRKFKAQVSDLPIGPKAELRVYEVIAHKIQKFFGHTDSISSVGVNSRLYIEEVLPEDKLHKGDMYVNVFHFNQHPSRGHGIPFKFPLRKGEPFSATRERLIARAQLQDKDGGKVKFFVVPSGFAQPTEILDSDVLAGRNFAAYDYIGIDHVGWSEKIVKDVNAGVGIKIKN
ncbi:putative ubiquitin-specific processing protease 21 [Obelidium mucronatum]|nr:putative ubiquitin-specific processing protease 21 [Obelidium mucronatum]